MVSDGPLLSSATLVGRLLDAIRDGNAEAVRMAVAAGADVNTFDPLTDDPALALAAEAPEGQRIAVSQALIDLGADIDQCHAEGPTALYCAVLACDPTLVGFLLERGADPDVICYAEDDACTVMDLARLDSWLDEDNLAHYAEVNRRYQAEYNLAQEALYRQRVANWPAVLALLENAGAKPLDELRPPET